MTSVVFKLGETKITAQIHQNKSARPTMLNVHDDEDTAVDAGKLNILESGGRVIELAHSGERLITFALDGKKYSFDPNRIFSEAGIEATLKEHGSYSNEAHLEIGNFAEEYLRRFALDQEPVIITLHNTVVGIFSVHSFLKAGYLASNAAAVHVSEQQSKFDFFYVTEREFFDYLKQLDFNVVLQNNLTVTEDGSMSVYFSRKGIPYINIEAEVSHLKNQVKLLRTARKMVDPLLQ